MSGSETISSVCPALETSLIPHFGSMDQDVCKDITQLARDASLLLEGLALTEQLGNSISS